MIDESLPEHETVLSPIQPVSSLRLALKRQDGDGQWLTFFMIRPYDLLSPQDTVCFKNPLLKATFHLTVQESIDREAYFEPVHSVNIRSTRM